MSVRHQQKLWDYLILVARVLIALVLIDYGWGKLTGDQFGITPLEMKMPVERVSLFRLSWYLFDQEPFKSFIGISQILAGLLLLYRRTFLLGALLSIPILLNILIIDITFIKDPAFYWRLSYYLILIFLILWHYRDRMKQALKSITSGLSAKFKYPVWAYLLLPVAVVTLELSWKVMEILTDLVIRPSETWQALCTFPEWVWEMVQQLS